jgi:hypothetical protein
LRAESDIEEMKQILREKKAFLREGFKVKRIGIFGSWVRNEQKKGSDIDILVEFEGPIGLLDFVALENYLSGLLGIKVDLVMKSALKQRIGERILKEVVYV